MRAASKVRAYAGKIGGIPDIFLPDAALFLAPFAGTFLVRLEERAVKGGERLKTGFQCDIQDAHFRAVEQLARLLELYHSNVIRWALCHYLFKDPAKLCDA